MRIPKPVIPEDRLMQYIQTQTAHSAGYVEGVLRDVEALKADARVEERKKKGECKFCFYLRTQRVGGAAITRSNCRACGTETSYTSTFTGDFCRPCAQKYQCCAICGGDWELRERRRKLVYG